MKIRILLNLKHNGVFYKKDSEISGEELNPLLSSLDNLIKKSLVVVVEKKDFVEALKEEPAQDELKIEQDVVAEFKEEIKEVKEEKKSKKAK